MWCKSRVHGSHRANMRKQELCHTDPARQTWSRSYRSCKSVVLSTPKVSGHQIWPVRCVKYSSLPTIHAAAVDSYCYDFTKIDNSGVVFDDLRCRVRWSPTASLSLLTDLSFRLVSSVGFASVRFVSFRRVVGQESTTTDPQEQNGLDRRRHSQWQPHQPPQPAPALRLSRSAPLLTRKPSRLQAFVAGLVVDVEVCLCAINTTVVLSPLELDHNLLGIKVAFCSVWFKGYDIYTRGAAVPRMCWMSIQQWNIPPVWYKLVVVMVVVVVELLMGLVAVVVVMEVPAQR